MRFTLALGLLFVAFVLQFWMATFSMPLDFVLAVLFACALVFDWSALLFFIALAILVLDWQPLWPIPGLIYLLSPFFLYAIRKIFSINAWIGLLIVTIVGVVALSLFAGPAIALTHLGALFIDIVASFVLALLSFFVLAHFS